jgi:hypothetical protein
METKDGNDGTVRRYCCAVAVQYEKTILQFQIPSEVQKADKVISGAYRNFPFWNLSEGT